MMNERSLGEDIEKSGESLGELENPGESLDELVKKFGAVEPEEIQIKLSMKTQELSRELVVKSIEAAKLKDQLTALHKRIQELQFKVLPDLFNEQELTSLGTVYGIQLEISPYYKASLPVDMEPDLREKGLQYLRENAPDIIKTQVSVSYDSSEYKIAVHLVKILRQMGVDPELKEDVHWATLTSWVKERFLAGEEIPFETLNAKVGSIVKITKEKEEVTAALNRLRQHTKASLPGG